MSVFADRQTMRRTPVTDTAALTLFDVAPAVTDTRNGEGRPAWAAVLSSQDVEWYTPAVYIEAARAVLGGIDLDPASCAEANETVGAASYYTRFDDGLRRPWQGRVWMNPPYGPACRRFVARLVAEYEDGNVTAAVALLNAASTETRWFRPLWDHTLCFTDHRIDFSSPESRASGSTHGSVFVYLGPDNARFVREFDRFGPIVQRATVTATRNVRLPCGGCDRAFTPLRSDARFCSPACRQRAYRRRKAAT